MASAFHAITGCSMLFAACVFGETPSPVQVTEISGKQTADLRQTSYNDDSDKPQNILHQAIPAEAEPTTQLMPSQQFYRSLSLSKQFIISGKDHDVISAISSKAESIRQDLLRILGCKDTWKHNISIRLFGAPGTPAPSNPVRLGIDIVGNQPTYIINLHIGRGIDLERLYGAVTTMLLYEMMLREVEIEGIPENILLPPWILLGLEQAILWKADMADRALYASLFERGEILPPDQVLKDKNPSKNLDATSFAAFKASCGALSLCLLNQKNGKQGMINLLREAILGSDDPVDLIKRNFSQINLTSTSLHKWWTLQLASMSTPPLTETMSIALTDQRLEEALKLILFDQETKTSRQLNLNQLQQVLSLSDLDKQLKNIVNNLIYLGSRCFPIYKPIIVEYSKIIALIQLGKTPVGDLEKRLEKIATLRSEFLKVSTRTRDYLDWFEISNKNKISNTFDSYMETMKLLRENRNKANTPLSKYLQDIEELYTLPAQTPTPRMKN